MKTKRQKREEAAARQAKYDRLSIRQRIALIETRRGRSKKERARLEEQLEESK